MGIVAVATAHASSTGGQGGGGGGGGGGGQVTSKGFEHIILCHSPGEGIQW